MTAPPTAAIEVRRLTYADLPQVVAIERRAFTTPWSLAMFVLELSKPSGVCLAAEVDGELAGYLVCSRYDLVWHIMNVSVDPDRRRRGIATAMLHALFERVGDPEAQFTLEVRRSNGGAYQLYEGLGFKGAGRPPPLLRRQRRGRGRDVAHPGDAARLARRRAQRAAAVILALETSCDDTCAAVIGRDGEIRSNVVSSQGVHDRYGGVVPEIASRHHLELVNAVVDDALARAGATLDDAELIAVTQGPGLVGALLVGVATAKGLAAARRLPLAPVDHLQGHVAANYLLPDPIEPPFLCLLASGGHTLLARVTEHGAHERLGSTLDDAAGEAFDKGARLLGLGYPGGPALSKLALDGDPQAFAFPTAQRVPGLDFSFAGLKTALLYKVRELGEEEAERRRADLAASYEHAIVETLILRVERALADEPDARLAIGGGVAANARLRERAAGLGVPVKIPPPSLCTDNAAMIGSAARWVRARPVPRLPGPRRLPDGGVSAAVTLYGRPGCHLCDVAREALERVRADAPFELREIDIERDDELFKRYLERIPVVCLDGEELFEYHVDEATLRRRLSLW